MTPLIDRKILIFPPKIIFYFEKKQWLKSFCWDMFWFQSGLWLSLLIIILDSTYFEEIIYAIGVFIFWIAHRFSSIYLAWGTWTFRPLCRKQPFRFLIFPVLLGLGVFVVIFHIPLNLLPFSIQERIIGLFFLDFFWGVHHFAAQHYGILRLYDNALSKVNSNLSKKQDRIFCWGVGGFFVIFAELLHGTSFLQENNFLTLPTNNIFLEGIPFLKLFGIFFVLGLTMLMIRNAFHRKTNFPKVLYLLGIGVMVMAAFFLDPFQFLMLWTLQHWMVSLGLASLMGGNDTKQNNEQDKVFATKSLTKYNKYKSLLVLFSLCIFSLIFTPLFELEAVSTNNSFTENFFPSLFTWLRTSEWMFFLVGLGIATGFIHYWMDRSVYRFSDKETSKVTKKLLFTEYDITKRF